VATNNTLAAVSADINVPKAEILIGEPLFVDVTFTNIGTADVTLSRSPDIGWALISKNGKDFEPFYDGMRGLGRITPRVLKPNEAATSSFTVCYRLRYDDKKEGGEFAFAEPGDYFVKGGYSDNLGLQAFTEQVKISVKQPVGEDLQAWSELRDFDAYGHLMQLPMSGHGQEALDKLAAIARKYPKSVYSAHILTAFSKRATVPPASSGSGSVPLTSSTSSPVTVKFLIVQIVLGSFSVGLAALLVFRFSKRHRRLPKSSN
jgi:hypothetical protein